MQKLIDSESNKYIAKELTTKQRQQFESKQLSTNPSGTSIHFVSSDRTYKTSTNYQYDMFTTSLQFTQSCTVPVTGQSSGSVTQYDSTSYMQVTSDYPSTMHCDYDWKDTSVEFTDLSGYLGLLSTCQVQVKSSPTGTVTKSCDIGLIDDALRTNTIFVVSNAYYDWGWLPFTALKGSTFIVY